MKILIASVEVAPFAKVGGLADVAGSLPKALASLGHDVRVVMPAYGMVLRDWRSEQVASFDTQVNPGRVVPTTIHRLQERGLDVWLVAGDPEFEAVEASEELYAPGRDAYLFFSRAVLAACRETGWMPDVVHANDWHTGFLPVLMRNADEAWESVASVFTIHNLAYQGEFGRDTLEAVGLPDDLYNMHELETFGSVNFLKAGAVFSDRVNTVSPTYAKEIQTEDYGCRLHGLMRWLAENGRLRGILNGIDLEVFDPATDRRIAANYSASDRSDKAVCRTALVEELDLKPEGGPLFGVISRLSEQKGFDLIVGGLGRLLDAGGTLVVLGTGDGWAAARLREWESKAPGQVVLIERFDPDLAQRIYSGADAFLMPSSFEPCGLGQMFAMRYGTIPVVRKTGGLADTVHEGQNGFVFEEKAVDAFAGAVERASAAFADSNLWNALVDRAMQEDFGWSRSAERYVEMYGEARQAAMAPPVSSRAR